MNICLGKLVFFLEIPKVTAAHEGVAVGHLCSQITQPCLAVSECSKSWFCAVQIPTGSWWGAAGRHYPVRNHPARCLRVLMLLRSKAFVIALCFSLCFSSPVFYCSKQLSSSLSWRLGALGLIWMQQDADAGKGCENSSVTTVNLNKGLWTRRHLDTEVAGFDSE